MKKIVSNVLVVSTQLIVGGLFLCMLFSDCHQEDTVVVIENDNLSKMADSVSELFTEEKTLSEVMEDTSEVELISYEEARKKEEEEALALQKAQEEAEEAARIAAEEEASKNLVTVGVSGYSNKAGMGFVVTTDNTTYSLSDDDFYILAAVVSCEANRASKDDILAVTSVILNRADLYGTDPISVVSAAGQFSCYSYYYNYTPSNIVNQTVSDALNGVRNNSYTGFNSWSNTSYSSNYIFEGGNRYR